MYIHTVTPGESLWQLSKKYSVPLQHIIEANSINEQDPLVIGQSIIIPTLNSQLTYKIKPNETLSHIAKMFGVTISALMKTNNIQNPALIPVGSNIIIPQANRIEIEVNAYLDRFNEPALELLHTHADSLTYVSIFSYSFTATGELIPIEPEEAISEAYAQNVTPMMTITNIVDEGFSRELMQTILTNPALQTVLITAIINMMQEKGFRALNVDLEYIPSDLHAEYNQFLANLAREVHNEDFLISSALAPKLSADQQGILYESHDYRINGELLDFVIIMTYEWGWTGGPPRAVAPLNEVKKVMEYALTEIPAKKLMMSMPLYGYDWTLPFVAGVSRARAILEQEAIALARRYHAVIQYDEVAQSPFFNYYDEQGRQHTVWFEDARSYQAKMNLAKSLNLRGISYWKLSMPAPINWFLLTENFTVKKLL